MVNGKVGGFFTTVLAGVVVAAEDLPPAERDLQTRAVNHVRQTDDRREGKYIVGGMNIAPAIEDQRGFLGQHESDRALITADVDRLKV